MADKVSESGPILATSDVLMSFPEENTVRAKVAAEKVCKHGVIAEVESGSAGGSEDGSRDYGTCRIDLDDVAAHVREIGTDVSVAVTGNVYGNHLAVLMSVPDAPEKTYEKADTLSASYGGSGTIDKDP